MKLKKSQRALRVTSLILVTVMALFSFASCKTRRLSPTKEAVASVGTITLTRSDGSNVTYDVPYEEFYFLSKNYSDSVADKYAEGTDEYKQELMSVISENITTNYAILALCEDMGLKYDEKELRDEVKVEIQNIIENQFNGSRGDYLEFLKENGMTDHYFRFIIGIDLLYSRLPMLYAQKGAIPNTDAAMLKHILENFVCTKHILIFNDSTDDADTNYANAEKARQLLLDGANINDIIGGKLLNVNEDFAIPYDGYYFGKGSMEEAYEKAAFDLEIGEVSQVVTSMAESNSGEYVKCYYVIQRMELDEKYINSHLTTLGDSLAESVVAKDLETLKSALTFVPNDFAKVLDVSELTYAGNGIDHTLIIVIVSSAMAAVAIAVAIIIYVRVSKKKIAEARAIRAKNNKK